MFTQMTPIGCWEADAPGTREKPGIAVLFYSIADEFGLGEDPKRRLCVVAHHWHDDVGNCIMKPISSSVQDMSVQN